VNDQGTSARSDLLLEVGTEELPPRSLLALAEAFSQGFERRLRDKGIGFGRVHSFATPRRLALLIGGVELAQPDQQVVRKGPALKAAYDQRGNPTRAALGFARSCGVQPEALEREESDKGSWLAFRSTQAGVPTAELIPGMLRETLAGLPIPKRMRWGDLQSEFVRPVHWAVILLGDAVVEAEILDVRAGRCTRGHRFHHPGPIELQMAGQYPAKLREQGWVEPDFAARRARIRELARTAASDLGARAVLEPSLLDEVTALCEWPVAVVGSFDPEFLEVPPEALIETMQKNQKYFPMVDTRGELLPNFIAISNIESLDPAQVRAGNERVIRPRFQDAAFFWEQDLKRPLAGYQEALKAVVFESRLGSLWEKSQRIGSVAEYIAGEIGLDPKLARRSAELCKCDLLTHMVGEFASLQGVMGRYYARAEGEDPCVSSAMQEHYQPRHAGEALPAGPCGQALALADRLDSLVGIFAIGQKPSGVKDPYGLRRAALGVLRILIETPLDLDLEVLLQRSAEALGDKLDAKDAAGEVLHYMTERLYGYYGEAKIRADVVDAVLETGASIPADIDRRVHAVMQFRELPEAESLAAANKRIRNILKKAQGAVPERVESGLFTENAERELYDAVQKVEQQVAPLFLRRDYGKALIKLAGLRSEVDSFFDQVMVMADEERVRNNRLALVKSVSNLFRNVADISLLQALSP
jgi:tetrameric-type glycyl-tRNA synthetase beta subunit